MISIRSKAFWATLLGSFWLLFAAVGQAADEIKVGLTVSLSGDLAELGQQQLQGMQMWQEDVNSRGELLGRPVKLVHYDDRSDPATSARLYQRLINIFLGAHPGCSSSDNPLPGFCDKLIQL